MAGKPKPYTLERIPRDTVTVEELDERLEGHRRRYPGANVYFDGDPFAIRALPPAGFGTWRDYLAWLAERQGGRGY